MVSSNFVIDYDHDCIPRISDSIQPAALFESYPADTKHKISVLLSELDTVFDTISTVLDTIRGPDREVLEHSIRGLLNHKLGSYQQERHSIQQLEGSNYEDYALRPLIQDSLTYQAQDTVAPSLGNPNLHLEQPLSTLQSNIEGDYSLQSINTVNPWDLKENAFFGLTERVAKPQINSGIFEGHFVARTVEEAYPAILGSDVIGSLPDKIQPVNSQSREVSFVDQFNDSIGFPIQHEFLEFSTAGGEAGELLDWPS